jgi:hypothetical protein
MSPSKLKSLLTGLLVVTFVAMSGYVMAQDGLRLFKPYGPESFGGGRRSNDGMYSSVSGIYWSISTPTDGYIGATTVNGKDETRWVWDADTFKIQTNSVKINMMEPSTTLGTRFEVGNRRGHHGWLVSGYGLPGQTHHMSAQNMTMTIKDEGRFNFRANDIDLGIAFSVWDRKTSPHGWIPYVPDPGVDVMSFPTVTGIGYLWGYFSYIATALDPITGELVETTVGVLAPLPIQFDNAIISVGSTHYSGELMYTYRAHPFTWGSMELLAGARYWEFNDRFGFQATSAGGAPMEDTTLLPITALTGLAVDAEGMNRVFGPQVGMKLNRQNARWTFGAEGRLTAGINAQTVKTQGSLTPRTYGFTGPEDAGQRGPLGLQNSNYNFGHKQNKAYFSPMGELRLSADWQWTDKVGFFGAVDGMFASNIARGVRVTDYAVHSDGTIFGIRGNDRNTSVFVYGVSAGIKVLR